MGACQPHSQKEIWAIWCEHLALNSDTATFQSHVQGILDSEGIQATIVVLGPSQLIPLQGQGDFVRFDGIWAHTQRAWAPDKAEHHGHLCPASGFPAPSEQLIAYVTMQGRDFPIVYSTVWDGAALGRTEAILR